jgi:hypothetical protein
LGFLPTIGPVSEIVVVSNQQERTPLTNDAVSQTTFNLPFIVAKVFVAKNLKDSSANSDGDGAQWPAFW